VYLLGDTDTVGGTVDVGQLTSMPVKGEINFGEGSERMPVRNNHEAPVAVAIEIQEYVSSRGISSRDVSSRDISSRDTLINDHFCETC
jgi:hypothetical protein